MEMADKALGHQECSRGSTPTLPARVAEAGCRALMGVRQPHTAHSLQGSLIFSPVPCLLGKALFTF